MLNTEIPVSKSVLKIEKNKILVLILKPKILKYWYKNQKIF